MRKKALEPDVLAELHVEHMSKGTGLAELGRRHNMSPTTMLARFREAGLPRLSSGRVYPPPDHDFFESIDTEEKAYWLGFLTADGCIPTPKPGMDTSEVRLELKSSDAGHLRLFLKSVGAEGRKISTTEKDMQVLSNGHIIKGGKTSSVSVFSKKMCADLLKRGVGPRKTWVAKPPEGIDGGLMRHYWRGVVDGDGHLINGNHPIVGLSGNLLMAQGFSDYFVAAGIVRSAKPLFTKGVWRVNIQKGGAIAAARHLYEPCTITLARKQEKARQMSDLWSRRSWRECEAGSCRWPSHDHYVPPA